MLDISSIVLRTSDCCFLCNPRLNVFRFAVEFEQFLGLDELVTSRSSELLQLAIFLLDCRLLSPDVLRVEVAAGNKSLTQRRQLLNVVVEVLNIELDRVQLLDQRLETDNGTGCYGDWFTPQILWLL